MSQKVIKILLCFLFSLPLMSPQLVYGQLNIKIGYSLGQASPSFNNSILGDLNQAREPLFDNYTPMQGLGFMYGVTIGLRQKFDLGSIEFSWERLSASRKLLGIQRPPAPAQAISFPYQIDYAFNQFLFTYESNISRYGLGSSLGYNLVNISSPTSNSEEKDRLDQGDLLFVRIHVALNFTGNRFVGFAIKPFYQLPLWKMDLDDLSDSLELTPREGKESFPVFGLSFVFYNGPQ